MQGIATKYHVSEQYLTVEVRIEKSSLNNKILDNLSQGFYLPAELHLDDGIHISVDQRKKIYALFRDFAEYTGYTPEYVKELFKEWHAIYTARESYSLAKCSMAIAGELIEFILEEFSMQGAPLSHDTVEKTKDIKAYMYYCIMSRVCCVSGEPADIHHVDAIGMGNNRKKVNHVGRLALPLSRKYHTEIHQIGLKEFIEKYHVFPIKLTEKMVEHLKL